MADTRDDDVPLDTISQRKAFLDLSHDQWRSSNEERGANEREAKTDLDFLNLKQWDDDVVKERGGISGHDKSSLTLDQIGEPYRQLTGRQRQAKPSIQVSPAGDGADQDTAEIFQGLIRHYEVTGHAKDARDEAFKGAAGPGWGYYGLLVEDETPESFKQTVTYRAVENIFTVYDDPDAKGALKRERRFLFLIQDLPKEEFKRLYPKARFTHNKDLFANFETCDLPDWYTDGGARVAEKWYLDDVVTGQLALLSDGRECPVQEAEAIVKASQAAALAPPGAVLNLNQAPAAVEIVRTKDITKRVVKWAKMSGMEILEGDKGDDPALNTEGRIWPGSMIPFVRVCGERLVVNGKETLRGIVRPMRDPQRLYNFNASCYADELASGPHAKVIMAEGQDEGHETLWDNPERRHLSRLIYKPTTIDGGMVAAPPPQIALFTDSAKLVALLQAQNQAKMDLKSASGYYDPSDPSRRNAEQSARAIEARKRESQESSSGLLDNYQSSLLYEGELLVDLIPKIVVPGQVLRILDMEDEPSTVMAGRPFMKGEGGKPMELPPHVQFEKGLHQFFDLNVGKFDVAVTVGASYSTRRQEAADTGMRLIEANPALFGIIGDLVIEQMDFPGAPAMAERVKKTLPPQLQADDNEGDLPPGVTAQIQSMKQQAGQVIEQLTQIVQKLEQDKAAKAQEMAAKVEIARMEEATKLRIAEMTAKNADAELRAEEMAQRLEGLFKQHQQMLDQAHEVGMQGSEQAHAEHLAEQEHDRDLAMAQLGQAHTLEQGQQAADLAPEPEAGA